MFFPREFLSNGDIRSSHVAQSDGHTFEFFLGISTESLFVGIEIIKFHAG